MKVLFNQTNFNYNTAIILHKSAKKTSVASSERVPYYERSSVNLPSINNYTNLSFRANHDATFLLNQAHRFRCAYSGRPMLSPTIANGIYQKLAKRPNAQSALNLLQNYEGFMLDIESVVFDIIKEASYKGKRDFQDILLEEVPEARERLKIKQIRVLNKANPIIATMSEEVAEQVRKIRDDSIAEVKSDTFGRKNPLEKIKEVKTTTPEDLEKVIQVYRTWYKSPSSGKDLDAFIVKYSKRTHEQIAKRLIRSSVASIEHVIPKSRNGSNGLGNFILVCAQYNNTRSSMRLPEYIELNEELNIPKYLQEYINDVVKETNDKKSPFNQRPSYVVKIINTLAEELDGTLELTHPPINIPRDRLFQEEAIARKLSKKYNVVTDKKS